MEFRYILFDMDGVLANTRDSIIATTKYTLSRFGRTPDPEVFGRIIGPPLFKIYHEIFGLEEEAALEAMKIYQKYYAETAVDLIRPFPGVRDMLDRLNAHDRKLMVCTARYEHSARLVLNKLGILDRFCFVGGLNGTGEGCRTKKADVIEYIMKELTIIDREHALMVGDRADDINAAKACGIASMGVLYGFGSREELNKAGADMLAETPADIADLIIQ